MKIHISKTGVYKLEDGLLSFTKTSSKDKPIVICTNDEFLVVVQEEQKDFCFTANKSSISLWDFKLKGSKSTYFLESGEIADIAVFSGYLAVFANNGNHQLHSADPFELLQEFDTETDLLSAISSTYHSTKSQSAQAERMKLRHQGEVSKYKDEIVTLTKQREQLSFDLQQAEVDLVQSKIAIKKLMNELVKNEKVDVEALAASLSKTSLKRRHSVATLKNSWSIPFLGISINTIAEDKED